MSPEESRETGRKIKTFFEREWKKRGREIEGQRGRDRLTSCVAWADLNSDSLALASPRLELQVYHTRPS